MFSWEGQQRISYFGQHCDNTEKDRTSGGDVYQIDHVISGFGPEWELHRFADWGASNFFAWETTVCEAGD